MFLLFICLRSKQDVPNFSEKNISLSVYEGGDNVLLTSNHFFLFAPNAEPTPLQKKKTNKKKREERRLGNHQNTCRHTLLKKRSQNQSMKVLITLCLYCLDQWLKVNVPKTTGWRAKITMASAAAGVFPNRRSRTCTKCGERRIRATGHSFHCPTRQSFCQFSDTQERTVEEWLTELRGGRTEKELLRDRQRVNRKKKKEAAAAMQS